MFNKKIMRRHRMISLFGYAFFGLYSIVVFFAGLFFFAFYSEFAMPFVAANQRPLVERGFFKHSDRFGWKLLPNININCCYEDSTEDLFLSTNSKGLRVSQFKEGRSTALLLGDSLVQGYFLKNEETLPWRLSELRDQNVINGGVGGYSTDQEYLLLEDLLKDYEFSWVGLVFFSNDLSYLDKNSAWGLNKPCFRIVDGRVDFKTLTISKQNPFVDVKAKHNPFVKVKDNYITLPCSHYRNNFKDKFNMVLKKFRKLVNRLIRSPRKFPTTVREMVPFQSGRNLLVWDRSNQYKYQSSIELYTDPKSFRNEFLILFDFLEQIQTISTSYKFKFFVVILPEIAQIVNKYQPEGIMNFQKYFLEMCEVRDIECFDPTKDFLAEQKKEDLYFMDDGHLSPHGTDFLAKLIDTRVLTSSSLETSGTVPK